MGNRQVTVEEYANLALKEDRTPMWGENGTQNSNYPTYWPPQYRADNGGKYEQCYFGKVFQLPEIDGYFNDKNKNNGYYPRVNFDEIEAPDSEIMLVIEQLVDIEKFWTRSIENRDMNVVTSLVIPLGNKYMYQIDKYVKKNFPEFLAYFGIIKSNSKNYTFSFKDGKVPLTFIFPIYTILLLFLVEHYKSVNAPFLNFKTGSAYMNPDANLFDVPTLQEFKKEIEIITFEQGNFWTEMGNKYLTKEEVLEFWKKNPELVESIKRFRKALKEGFLYASPGIDSYYFRESLVQFMKFKDGPSSPFNFTFFRKFIDNRYTPTVKIDRVVLLYFMLMVYALEKLLGNDFFELPLGKPHQRLPLIDIKPIDLISHGWFFRDVKKAWLETAQWTLFGRPDNNYLHYFGLKPDNEFRMLVWGFITTYPIRPLKVPPFSFGEWTRHTVGWKKVTEQQWDDYFEWAVANVFASRNGNPNYVLPGQQLLDTDGLPLWEKPPSEGFLGEPLLNTYPDYGVLTEIQESWFGPSFKLLLPWTVAADWIWGDNFWEFVNGTVKFIFKKVLDALKAIADVLPAVLPALLLLAGLGVGAYFVTRPDNNLYIQENKK
jgi:hypothetical protein